MRNYCPSHTENSFAHTLYILCWNDVCLLHSSVPSSHKKLVCIVNFFFCWTRISDGCHTFIVYIKLLYSACARYICMYSKAWGTQQLCINFTFILCEGENYNHLFYSLFYPLCRDFIYIRIRLTSHSCWWYTQINKNGVTFVMINNRPYIIRFCWMKTNIVLLLFVYYYK